jgi:MFS family permease
MFSEGLAIRKGGRDAQAVEGVRRQLAESAAAFRAVFRNTNLRRLQLAAIGSEVGHWSYATAVSVYAFEHAGGGTDGAKAVGLLWVIRMVPSALATPFASLLGDRFRREWVMLGSDLVRAAAIIAGAIAIWDDAPAAVIYVLAAVVSVVAQAFEPAQRALMPSLATTPAELTAANVASSTIESIGFFVGPALAGVLLAWASVPTVFVVTAGTIAWSAYFISRLRPPAREKAPSEEPDAAEVASSFVQELLAGFKALGQDARLRLLIGLLGATTFVIGMYEVLTVSIAFEYLHIGDSGVGYLNTGFGVGALLGAFAAALLVGVRRLSVPLTVGALLMGPPVILLAGVKATGVAIVCLGLLGVGNTLVDVSGFTLVQRAIPEHILARAFGVLNLIFVGSIAVGAAVAPALISGLGVRGTLIASGCVMPVMLLAFGPRLIRIDAAASAPPSDVIELLRRTPIFAPLPGASLETLVARLIPVSADPGDEIIREGDTGDRFYLIAEGEVDVSAKGAPVATLGPGDYVGEIALLHDVPRTATVVAKTPVSLYALERDEFLSAIGSEPSSREAVESVAAARLTGLRSAIGGVAVPKV